MDKIIIERKNNQLYFSKNTDKKNKINLITLLAQNELLFSNDYINDSQKRFQNFISDDRKNYFTIVVKEMELVPYILKIVDILNIEKLIILENISLSYYVCQNIIESNIIRNISCYDIPLYLLNMLDKKNIIVDNRIEIMNSSSMMQQNNLDKFTSLYYKSNFELTFPLSKNDKVELDTFIKYNKYLNTIYINNFNKNDLLFIIHVLKDNNFKNIIIYIKGDIVDKKLYKYLKKLNKKIMDINNIKIVIEYSDEYINSNIVNQLQHNMFKLCSVLCIVLVGIMIIQFFFNRHQSLEKVEDIQEEIKVLIVENKEEVPTDIKEVVVNEEVNDKVEYVIPTSSELNSLLSINDDTVGWLRINNTNVNYPIVQTNDNDYYLDKNFKKETDKNGWIFMDFRNNSIALNYNTIIYGHNTISTGVMFGTLNKVLKENWYKNSENQMIIFNNLQQEMKWKIFSIYTIPETNDYLYTTFQTNEEYQQFIDLIKSRSLYNFDTQVTTTDKILTLSTCYINSENRLVIHAVLVP